MCLRGDVWNEALEVEGRGAGGRGGPMVGNHQDVQAVGEADVVQGYHEFINLFIH